MEAFILPTETIVHRASALLERFHSLPKYAAENKLLLPQDFDPTRMGGYLCLFDTKHDESYLFQIGKIPTTLDPEYVTKREKYLRFALKKAMSINQEKKILSSQTDFKVKGGVKADDQRIMSFSGLSPEGDEALVILLAYQCSWISFEYFMELTTLSQNPYLINATFKDYLLAA